MPKTKLKKPRKYRNKKLGIEMTFYPDESMRQRGTRPTTYMFHHHDPSHAWILLTKAKHFKAFKV